MPTVEGGGPNPPYRESFLENIVNVSWHSTGGAFVSGDRCCYQRYTRLEDNKSDRFAWIPLGSLAFGDGGGTTSGSYGKTNKGPVFLLGGHGHGHGVLIRSTDGVYWTEMQAGRIMGDNIDGLVWHKKDKLFYADGGGTRCYYSADGISWSYARNAFADYCVNPLGAPDGFYGYDKSHDLVIYPNGGEAVAITNASTIDAEEFPIWVGLPTVNAVNFTGGIWMIGGGVDAPDVSSGTVCSLDGGNSWFYSTVGPIDMTGDFEITVMVGAPIQDFKGKKLPGIVTPAAGTPRPPPVTAPTTVGGHQNASRSSQPGRSIVATAISPSRRPRLRLPRNLW